MNWVFDLFPVNKLISYVKDCQNVFFGSWLVYADAARLIIDEGICHCRCSPMSEYPVLCRYEVSPFFNRKVKSIHIGVYAAF